MFEIGMKYSQAQHPQISVLLPVHNGENDLAGTVDCILQQSFQNFELLIMDDASTDGTWDLMEKLGEQDARIRLFRFTENQGIVKGLNRLADNAMGEFLFREDCGDFSHPERYALQVKALSENPEAVACVCNYWKLEQDGTPLGIVTIPRSPAAIQAELRHMNNICHASFALRRTAFFEVGCYDEVMYCAQDYDLLLKLIKLGPIITINQALVAYRLDPGGITYRNARKQRAFAELARARAFGGIAPDKFDHEPVARDEAEASYHSVVGRLHLAKGRPMKARRHFETAMQKWHGTPELRRLHKLTYIPGTVIRILRKLRGKNNPDENQPPTYTNLN